jgi:hypothetical protein
MSESATHNGQIPSDPTTLTALLITFCITKLVPADQIGAALMLYPFIYRLLAVERR